MNDSRQNDGLPQIIVFVLVTIVILGALVVGGSGGTPTSTAVKATLEAPAAATVEAPAETLGEAVAEVTPEAPAGMGDAIESADVATPASAVRVYFASPADGATVPTTFTVEMGAEGLTVEPAGEVRSGAGHFHILIDAPFIPAGEAIPKDDTHLHFGMAQTSAELTLTPGDHVLRLQFADGTHVALDGDQYRDEITVHVE